MKVRFEYGDGWVVAEVPESLADDEAAAVLGGRHACPRRHVVQHHEIWNVQLERKRVPRQMPAVFELIAGDETGDVGDRFRVAFGGIPDEAKGRGDSAFRHQGELHRLTHRSGADLAILIAEVIVGRFWARREERPLRNQRKVVPSADGIGGGAELIEDRRDSPGAQQQHDCAFEHEILRLRLWMPAGWGKAAVYPEIYR